MSIILLVCFCFIRWLWVSRELEPWILWIMGDPCMLNTDKWRRSHCEIPLPSMLQPTWPLRHSPLPNSSPRAAHRQGLIQKCMVVLCSLASTRSRSVRESERAARHHTEAPLKIHVYHYSSLIDALSSLYVYEVRGLPVALLSDPWGLLGCPRNCLFPLMQSSLLFFSFRFFY